MLNMDKFGISQETLTSNMFKPSGSDDRVLLYDGDGSCYTVSAGVQRLGTAQSRLEKDILTMMFLAKCSTARVHLTPKGCLKNNRHLLLGVKGYQLNRGSAKKPALLEQLRDSAPLYFQDHPEIKVFGHYEVEADDALMMDVYNMSNGVLLSADKDLLISPKEQYMPDTGQFVSLPEGERFGWITRKEWTAPSGRAKAKTVGKGTAFFLYQLLAGDSADNVKGIRTYGGKLCGDVGAYSVLEGITCEHEAVNKVLDAYRVIEQNIIPEAYATWLLRHPEDNAYKYLSSNELTTENRAFLDDCFYNRKWCITQDEYNDMSAEQYAQLFE